MRNIYAQKLSRYKAQSRKKALHNKNARSKTFCSLAYFVFVLPNDWRRMKGNFHLQFYENREDGGSHPILLDFNVCPVEYASV
mgnify:CR=1 FL=1